MKSVRTAISVVLAALLLTSIVSCTDNGKNEHGKSEAPSVSESGESSAENNSQAESEVNDEGFAYATDEYSGTIIKILAVDTSRHPYGLRQFVPDEELKSNAINEAVRERNNYISANYGIEIKVRNESYPTEVIEREINTDIADYDLVCDSVDRMCTKMLDGLFIQVDDLFDFEDPWWNSESIDMLSLDGVKHFFVSGDCMLTDVDNIYLTLFNKTIYEDNSELSGKYGDIYQLVKDRKFTLDNFTTMCRTASHADENGSWSFEATYGNLSHSYGATIMVNGGNVSTVEKSSDGIRCAVLDEHSQSVFSKVYELMSDKQITARAELIIGQGTTPSKYGFAELEELFTSGRGLFYNTTVGSISILKNSQAERGFEFGVLPIPLYNDEQDRYCCAVNRYQSSVIGIPISSKNTEAAAFLLNALGYLNTKLPTNVMDAYYEITLKAQGTDTEDDSDMLDLIFNSVFYDLGSIFEWGNLAGIYGNVISNANSNELVSIYSSNEGTIESAIQESLLKYGDLS